MAAAKGISMDAAMEAVLTELDGIHFKRRA